MKKVLMLGPVPPPQGGIVSVMHEMMHSPLNQYCTFEIFPTSGGPLNVKRGTVGQIAARMRKFLCFFFKVLLRDYDLVHVHASKKLRGVMLYMMLSRLAGKPVILQIHYSNWSHVFEHGSPALKWITRKCLNLPMRILVMNPSWLSCLAEVGLTTEVKLVRNLLAPAERPDEAAICRIRETLGITEKTFVVMMVGVIGSHKGVYDILEAAYEVVAQHQDTCFVFVGGEYVPGEAERFCKVVDDKKIGDCVVTCGEVPRDSIPAFLSCSHVFLLPSHWEAMPISILEAMRAGLPIIATPVGAVPQMIEHEKSGLLVPVESPRHIAEAVLRLINDEAFRAQLGKGAEQAFVERFQSSVGWTEIEAVYQETCA